MKIKLNLLLLVGCATAGKQLKKAALKRKAMRHLAPEKPKMTTKQRFFGLVIWCVFFSIILRGYICIKGLPKWRWDCACCGRQCYAQGKEYSKRQIKEDIPKFWAEFYQTELKKAEQDNAKTDKLNEINKEIMQFIKENQDPKNTKKWYKEFRELLKRHNMILDQFSQVITYANDT